MFSLNPQINKTVEKRNVRKCPHLHIVISCSTCYNCETVTYIHFVHWLHICFVVWGCCVMAFHISAQTSRAQNVDTVLGDACLSHAKI
jgi:hypothetical protein